MGANTRVELTSGSPSLERSGSFHEGGDNRMFCSGDGMSRVSGMVKGNLPPLSKCLMLEPIIMSDQSYTLSDGLSRVLGSFVGSASEDKSFGAAHSMPLPPMAVEELERYKESILDANSKARDRAKTLEEHLHRLNGYVKAVNFKEQRRNEELSMAETTGL